MDFNNLLLARLRAEPKVLQVTAPEFWRDLGIITAAIAAFGWLLGRRKGHK